MRERSKTIKVVTLWTLIALGFYGLWLLDDARRCEMWGGTPTRTMFRVSCAGGDRHGR